MAANELDYFRQRALEERARAAGCRDPSIAKIHLDLAEEYEALADLAEKKPALGQSWGGLSSA